VERPLTAAKAVLVYIRYYVNTLDQVADCLTKPLSADNIRRFHGALSGMAPIPHPAFGAGYGRIGLSLASPDTMPLLSDV
jgi:hypothetical protein